MESLLPTLKATAKASRILKRASFEKRCEVVLSLAYLLQENVEFILNENKKDLDQMDPTDSKYDRLLLTEQRISNLVQALESITHLEDPTGKVLLERTLPNGIQLSKITTPMGVIGTIFESRPNVTIDVAALCLISGNAAVLKGGKEAQYSNQALVSLIHQALERSGIPTETVVLLPSDRKFTNELLQADKYVDLIIPRGSQGLIQFVRENSKIPTIETGAGVCHVYVEKTAQLPMAVDIVLNAKASRPSVCNSLDCLLVDEAIAAHYIPMLKEGFEKYHIGIYADPKAFEIAQKANISNLYQAQPDDFGKEWLDYKLSIKLVENLEQALDHIDEYSSKHSEAIVTENLELAQQFIQEVDAAAVYHNASTRFTDGGEFGLGAEIGISTQKLHARGPFALEKLVTEKWIGQGKGQTRW